MPGPLAPAALLLALLAPEAPPPPVPARLPVLDGMLTALGGRERIEALKSLSVEAECLGPGGPFNTIVRSVRPGRVNFRQTSDRGRTEIWSTPSATWTIGDDGKPQKKGGAVRAFVRGHEFHLLLFEIYDRFGNHEVRGTRTVNGTDCVDVGMADEQGRPASICIDPADHLPVSLQLNPEGAEGTITVLFDHWVAVGGLNYFWSFVLTEGTRGFRYEYVGIEPDSIPGELFHEPGPAD